MRKLILLLSLIIAATTLSAKKKKVVNKNEFVAYAFCTRDNDSMEYTPWESNSSEGVLDMQKMTIIINDYDNPQVYKIDFFNEDEFGNFIMQCINSKGVDCIVRAEPETIDGERFYHLYIDYSDVTLGFIIQFKDEQTNEKGIESILPTLQQNTSEQLQKQE
ncbi:MAG: hypothetical protein J6P49_01465 [Paludibacteraceae bacterium]|nr:hypothetical protein [Paludibacteraceae bacterium]MBP5136395.1 hypothetical protein [Paludibacteraceae bacterium]